MEPTYRIELKHDPHSETLPWDARIYLDGEALWLHTCYGATQDDALTAAQAWVRAEQSPRLPGRTVYATEDGDLVTVRALPLDVEDNQQ